SGAGGVSDDSKNIVISTADLARPSLIAGDIVKLNSYVKMFKSYLVGGGVDAKSTVLTEEEKTKYATEGYNVKMDLSLAGETEHYVMYYKELATVAGDGYDKDAAINEEDDEVEVSTSLVGIIVHGTETFNLTGLRTVDKKGTEVEVELEFKILKDTTNYVTVEQEFEDTEREFEYSITKDGKEISKTEVEFENEKGDVKMEVALFDGTKVSEIKYKLDYTKKDGKELLSVTYTNSKISGTFTIDITGDIYTYSYDNNFTETEPLV
ncbi:MAG: hypothetical protein RR334_01060, partial [Clostridia bacterium]